MKKLLGLSMILLLFAGSVRAQTTATVNSISSVTSNSAVANASFSLSGAVYTLVQNYNMTLYMKLSIVNYKQGSMQQQVLGTVYLGALNSNNIGNLPESYNITLTGLNEMTNYSVYARIVLYDDPNYTQYDDQSKFQNGGPDLVYFTTPQAPETHVVDTINTYFRQTATVGTITSTSAIIQANLIENFNWTDLNSGSLLKKLIYGPMKINLSSSATNISTQNKWLGAPCDTSILITGLNPSTKYYIMANTGFDTLIDGVGNLPGYYLNSPIDSFTTRPVPVSISNNYIHSSNQVICNYNGTYTPSTFIASMPVSNDNQFIWTWQISSDGGLTWTGAAGVSNTQNYTPPPFTPLTHNTVNYLYRRIVSNASVSDTSSSIRLTLVSLYQPHTVCIWQEHMMQGNGEMFLNLRMEGAAGDYEVIWKSKADSLDETYFTPIPALPGGNLLLSQGRLPASVHTVFKAFVNYQNSNCPAYESAIIGITPPDTDGNYYPTVRIGPQVWMMNNLRVTSGLSKSTGSGFGNAFNTPTYSWYENDSVKNSIPLGALYNLATLEQKGDNVCPTGWRIAKSTDWLTLENSASPGAANSVNDLKSTYGWPTRADGRLNFNALPAGQIDSTGNFYGKNFQTIWWGNASDNFKIYSSYKMIDVDNTFYFTAYTDGMKPKERGYSIRCIQKD